MDREGIGEKLKTLRMQKELSISDVSKATGVSESTIYNYEAGYRVPRDEMKVKLANLYGVSPLIFFEQQLHFK